MKKFIFTTSILLMVSLAFAQTSVCGQFHKKYCGSDTKDDKGWRYNAQSRSGLFSQGSTSKIRCVIYKGMDYQISVCSEAQILGDKISYKIFDARTNELLFDNATSEDAKLFEFQSTATRQLVIEVTIPMGSAEMEKHKPTDAACVGLLILHRLTDRQGFSSY